MNILIIFLFALNGISIIFFLINFYKISQPNAYIIITTHEYLVFAFLNLIVMRYIIEGNTSVIVIAIIYEIIGNTILPYFLYLKNGGIINIIINKTSKAHAKERISLFKQKLSFNEKDFDMDKKKLEYIEKNHESLVENEKKSKIDNNGPIKHL